MEDTNNIYPIRVLQIVGKICGGGVESVIMNYYRNIDRSRVIFDFIVEGNQSPEFDNEVNCLGGKVYYVTPYVNNIYYYMRDIYWIIAKNAYEIVHCNMNAMSVFPLFAAYLAGANIRIIHNHSTADKSERARAIIKYILRPFAPLFANRYLACSKLAAKWMYGQTGIDKKDVFVLNNAIDVDAFVFSGPIRERYRKKLGLSPKKLVIGHVGRFMHQKNHAFLVQIFSEIVKENNDAVLILIGDGPLKKEIEKKVEILGLKDNVMFLGLRKDVSLLYNVMDAFVLPSYYEGLPVVAVEAQANGLPCVFSDNITKESALTSSVSFQSLNSSAMEWSKTIQCVAKKRNRLAESELKDAGFDIKNMSNTLVDWYTYCLQNNRI